MSIAPDWRQIAGLEICDDGLMAAVWIAHDPRADVVHLWDCAIYRREVPALIAEALNNHGRWIPIAWEKKARPMVKRLEDRGCNMILDPFEDDDAVAEAVARDIWGRMRSGRFRIQKGLSEWEDEFKKFTRTEMRVPREGFPLMTATRFAIGSYAAEARPQKASGASVNHPNYSVV